MTRPVINKPLEDWEFSELVAAMSWEVVQSLLSGTKLETTMHAVCTTTALWKEEQQYKQKVSRRDR